MPADQRLFRNATEAIVSYKMSHKDDVPEAELFETRFWRAFNEKHPGLDPQAVERVLRSNWDELETMRSDQALDRLVMLAGGRRSPAMPSEPKEKDIWDPETPLTLSELVHKRREVRRIHGDANEQRLFERRRADAPLEKARQELAEIRSKPAKPA